MSNLDILNTEKYHREIFGFTDAEPYNAIFLQAGYETSNFIIESGTLLFVIIGYILITALILLLRCATKKCGDNFLTRRLRKRSSHNVSIVRFLLEGSLELGLVATMSLIKVDNNFTFNHILSSVLLIVLFITPVYLIVAALKVKKSQAEDFDEE